MKACCHTLQYKMTTRNSLIVACPKTKQILIRKAFKAVHVCIFLIFIRLFWCVQNMRSHIPVFGHAGEDLVSMTPLQASNNSEWAKNLKYHKCKRSKFRQNQEPCPSWQAFSTNKKHLFKLHTDTALWSPDKVLLMMLGCAQSLAQLSAFVLSPQENILSTAFFHLVSAN